MKTAKTQFTKITDLVPDSRNANLGTERGLGTLEASLRDLGAGRSILTDKHGNVIAGNKTLEAAVNAGLVKLRVVDTDGTELVAVRRTDLDLKKDKRAKKLAIADNRIGELSLRWDPDVLAELYTKDEIELAEVGFTPDELKELIECVHPSPEEFASLDSVTTNIQCPKCGFKWKEGKKKDLKKRRPKLREDA